MHFHFDFSARQVLWTLTFAAQLVLLVVLLGRDRAARYPWFTAGIALSALQLMAEVLLVGRMAMIPLQEILLTLADLGVILALLVVVEVARRAFAGFSAPWDRELRGIASGGRRAPGILGALAGRQGSGLGLALGRLHLMQLVALKGNLLVNLLTVELGLLVVLFGRHFKAGWRSHTQMIAIGLSTVAISWLATQETLLILARTAHPRTQQEYDRIFGLSGGLVGRLLNANNVVYLAALVWWIAWLWLDEPGTAPPPAADETAPRANRIVAQGRLAVSASSSEAIPT